MCGNPISQSMGARARLIDDDQCRRLQRLLLVVLDAGHVLLHKDRLGEILDLLGQGSGREGVIESVNMMTNCLE